MSNKISPILVTRFMDNESQNVFQKILENKKFYLRRYLSSMQLYEIWEYVLRLEVG